jgi:hypothetical protein
VLVVIWRDGRRLVDGRLSIDVCRGFEVCRVSPGRSTPYLSKETCFVPRVAGSKPLKPPKPLRERLGSRRRHLSTVAVNPPDASCVAVRVRVRAACVLVLLTKKDSGHTGRAVSR